MTISETILLLCEKRVLDVRIGDILDLSHIHTDLKRKVGRIRGVLSNGMFMVEYTDGKRGVFVVPKQGVSRVDTSNYKEFVVELHRLSREDPEVDLKSVMKTINHWIRNYHEIIKKDHEAGRGVRRRDAKQDSGAGRGTNDLEANRGKTGTGHARRDDSGRFWRVCR